MKSKGRISETLTLACLHLSPTMVSPSKGWEDTIPELALLLSSHNLIESSHRSNRSYRTCLFKRS